MRPALNPEVLKRLPLDLRNRATRAMLGNRIEMMALFRTQRLQTSHRAILAAVLYGALDPSPIPATLPANAAESAHWQQKIDFVLQTCEGFGDYVEGNFLRAELLEDIWQRVWCWLQFIETVLSRAGPDRDDLRSDFYKLVVETVTALVRFEELHRLSTACVWDTDGVFHLIGTAWFHLVRLQEASPVSWFWTEWYNIFLPESSRARTPDLTELASGVGGNWDSLAVVIVKHLRQSMPQSGMRMAPADTANIEGLLYILQDSPGVGFAALHSALARNGLIDVLVRAAHTYLVVGYDIGERVREDNIQEVVHLLWTALCRRMDGAWSARTVAEAVQAGFLSIFLFYRGELDNPANELDIRGNLCTIMGYILRDFMGHRTVLTEIRNAFVGIDHSAQLHTRVATDLWQTFFDLASERIQILDLYESGELPKLRACDNLQCGKVLPRQELKRCSECKAVYYCSQACQRADYRDPQAGHRSSCLELGAVKRATLLEYAPKDRSFLVALLNWGYDRHRVDIALRYLDELRRVGTNGTKTLYTVFDWTSGVCRIEVFRSLEGHAAAGVHIPQRWLADPRAEVHIMGLRRPNPADDDRVYWSLVPLRLSSEQLRTELEGIAADIPTDVTPAGMEGYRPAVVQLLAGLKCTYTH
ncbi:MYND-type domain-containing protein [Mycena kentingensis (nom. inval.)]|nr:MYND-type domain-containing protein [Mycena kentingensis (nom. inval.)]